jgi:hypothetical protein
MNLRSFAEVISAGRLENLPGMMFTKLEVDRPPLSTKRNGPLRAFMNATFGDDWLNRLFKRRIQ